MTVSVTSTKQHNAASRHAFDVEAVRKDFPILQQMVYGKPLAYLDNAATTQKPNCVIEAIQQYYQHDNANVHRGLHALSERATAALENARARVGQFINAGHTDEIVFLRGATEAINLVASSYGQAFIKPGDEILISEMEHHSNIVPWKLLCERSGAVLRVIPITDMGDIDQTAFEKLLGEKTRLLALAHASNALGTVNPIAQMIDKAHQVGAHVLIDGAQATPHMRVDVQALDCDFYVLSAHKMYGPTGIGALYAKRALLEAMPPYQGGGEMIATVSFDKITYNQLPFKFEAGTPNIAGAIGFAAAIAYLQGLDWPAMYQYEADLLDYASDKLSATAGCRIIGTAKEKIAVISFLLDDIHAHDVGTILDREGIAIRTGHHCAMPVMTHFSVPATARVSLSFYNTKAEIDRVCAALEKVKRVFHEQ